MNKIPENYNFKIGEKAITARRISCFARTFEAGTLVTVIGIDKWRGYDIQNEYGEQICETGFSSLIPIDILG